MANDDEAFVEVRSEVDKVMSEAVFATYGEFTELTTPILTQVSILMQFQAYRILTFILSHIRLILPQEYAYAPIESISYKDANSLHSLKCINEQG